MHMESIFVLLGVPQLCAYGTGLLYLHNIYMQCIAYIHIFDIIMDLLPSLDS